MVMAVAPGALQGPSLAMPGLATRSAAASAVKTGWLREEQRDTETQQPGTEGRGQVDDEGEQTIHRIARGFDMKRPDGKGLIRREPADSGGDLGSCAAPVARAVLRSPRS